MTETTTVRVRTVTRDALNEEAEESGTTADAVIQEGLLALREERLRRRIEEDARLAAADPEDRAEIREVMLDMHGEV